MSVVFVYPVAGSCDQNNEPLGSIMGGGLLNVCATITFGTRTLLLGLASRLWIEVSSVCPFLTSFKLLYFPFQHTSLYSTPVVCPFC
jgi:hypothetical protein